MAIVSADEMVETIIMKAAERFSTIEFVFSHSEISGRPHAGDLQKAAEELSSRVCINAEVTMDEFDLSICFTKNPHC